MQELIGPTLPTKCRVSSVLNRDRQQFGSQNMFDGSDVSCWNSGQGSPQQILLSFNRAVNIRQVEIMFQGGFVGQDIEVLIQSNLKKEGEMAKKEELDPEESNALQKFDVHADDVVNLQLTFNRSTDFYGRIVIYHLQVLGYEIESSE